MVTTFPNVAFPEFFTNCQILCLPKKAIIVTYYNLIVFYFGSSCSIDKRFSIFDRQKLWLFLAEILSFFFVQVSESDINGLSLLARLSDHHVYATLNAKNQFRAPTEWGICLRPSGLDSEDETPGLRCLACDSERARTCWLTAMRLAKVKGPITTIILYTCRWMSRTRKIFVFFLQFDLSGSDGCGNSVAARLGSAVWTRITSF